MMTELITMDRKQAASYEPGPRELCISICSTGADHPKLHPGWLAVLQLEFDDCELKHEDLAPVYAITPTQADRIVEFIKEHSEPRRLVIHCEAGISRSVSIAAAISHFFNFVAPNFTVYMRMTEALLRGRTKDFTRHKGVFGWPESYQPNMRQGLSTTAIGLAFYELVQRADLYRFLLRSETDNKYMSVRLDAIFHLDPRHGSMHIDSLVLTDRLRHPEEKPPERELLRKIVGLWDTLDADQGIDETNTEEVMAKTAERVSQMSELIEHARAIIES